MGKVKVDFGFPEDSDGLDQPGDHLSD